jgi:uncharacterized repeat protein (TIGR01451 family)
MRRVEMRLLTCTETVMKGRVSDVSEESRRGRRHRGRRRWLVGTALLALVAFAVVFAAASSADLTGSTFESTDGDLVVTTSGHTDWANVAGLQASIDVPSGSSDNSFGQGTKEDDPAVTIVDGSIPPEKNDLTRAYLASETVGGQTFLYLAWERAVNTGSANLDFELDQNATAGWTAATTGDVTINRTEGDLLFTYDFGGSGTPTLGLNFWLTSGHGHTGSDCTASSQHTLPCWGNHLTLSPSGTPAADGAVNTGDVTDNVTSPAVGTLTAGRFGEAAINLTAIPGIFSSDTCRAFGSQFVKSRASGSSVDAELKDFIAPSPIHVSNCGSIELKKHWVGAPGSATLKIGTTAGASDTASQAVSGADGTTGAQEVENGNYHVSETVTNANDYTTALSCSDNGGTAFDPGTGNIPVSANHNVVCTFTNTLKPISLTVIKHVINDNGGSKTAADFTMHVTNSANPADFPGAEAGTAVTVNAGSYSVSETGPDGYTASLSAGCSGTLAPGSSATCTITNNDVPPGLTVIKHVINDNGGTKTAADFTMHVTNSANPADFPGAEAGTHVNVNAGSYSVTETGPAGYASSLSAGCSGTIATGGTATCTITNNDIAPTLTVIKHVINDNGGTKTAADFTMHVTNSANPADFPGAEAGTSVPVKAGSYTVSETGSSGYTASMSAGCSGTLALGGTATCTVTNDDDAATIAIEKRVLPSTDKGTFKFALTQGESQTVLDNGTDGYGNGDSTGQVDVNTGNLGIVESGNGATSGSLYTSSWSCSSNRERSASGAGTSISLQGLQLGEHVTCTFTNTKLATLVVRKVVDNSNGGGSKGPGDFSLHVTTAGLEVPGSPAAGSATGTTYTLLPGTYKVSEGAVSGYSLTKLEGCLADGSVTLEAGQTATCTLTNTSAAPPPPPPPPPPAPRIDLQITKSAAPNPANVGNQVTWTMVVTNNGPNNATGVTMADPVPAGLTFVSATSSQGSCTGGALVSCTIGNMNVGSSVTITLVTTAATTGTITNTATTVGKEQETNTANNSASAQVVVNGVFTPPAVTYCTAVSVTPKQLFAGRKNMLTMKLTSHGKAKAGVRVKIKGSTINLTTNGSNGKGIVKQTVKPMKAGIVVFQPVATKSCKNPRVGVIGVFTPPVTG